MDRSQSRQTVFILGAGASVHAGGPTMRTFIDRADELYRSDAQSDSQFKLFFEALSELRRVHSNASIDTDNIEAVFGAFEMAELLGLLRWSHTLLDATIHVIVTTLENEIKYPIDGESIRPPIGYEHFATFLSNVCEKEQVSVLTFNYDCALDYAIDRSPFYHVDYCLDSERHGDNWIPLLKLHGSLNWRLDEKELIVTGSPWNAKSLRARGGEKSVTIEGHRWFAEDTFASLTEYPVIVPPTWSKLHQQAKIKPVWKAAAAKLSEAENIIVLGYSLPKTDQFFRHLFALGTLGETRIKKFWVIDVDPLSLGRRFKDMLGQQLHGRYRLYAMPFESVAEILRNKRDDWLKSLEGHLGSTEIPTS